MFKPYQPRDRLSMSLSLPDIHAISAFPRRLDRSSKFYQYRSRKADALGDKDGELPQLIRSTQCGFSLEVHQAQESAAVISKLAEDAAGCNRLGQQARMLFDQRFEKSYAEKAWQRVIAEAMHQG
ncbi:MAG: hypothetical protein R3B37_11310 [Nitrospira sp.]|nr:hypothetical protein [Nitrospira sp.]